MQVLLDYVLSITNPFETDVWSCGPITLQMVDLATPVLEHWNPDDDDQIWTAEQHAGRIKYLASQKEMMPICLDVGVPALMYDVQSILDGHHRLAAAVYRQDKYIECEIQGQVGYVEELVRLFNRRRCDEN